MIAEILLIICGSWWILSGLVNKTKNFKSSIFYNVIPFFTGVIVIGIALAMIGVINIPV